MLRVMTVNLFNDHNDQGELARVLDAYEPDVVLTQELGPEAAAVIKERFAYADLRPGTNYLGWGIVSQVPVEFGGPGPWGRGGVAVVDRGPMGLHIANVHIVDPLHLPVMATQRKRRGQLEKVLEWGEALPAGASSVVAGDLNASPIWPVYRRLTAVWEDLAESGAAGRPERTWGPPGGPRLLRLDHVLGRGLTALDAIVAPIRGSDHAAVIVDVDFDDDV